MKDIEQSQEEELEQVEIEHTTLELVCLAIAGACKFFLVIVFSFVYLGFAIGIYEGYTETKNPNDMFILIGVTIIIIMLRIWYLVENPKKED